MSRYLYLDLDKKRVLEREEWAILFYDRLGRGGGAGLGRERNPVGFSTPATSTRNAAFTWSCSGWSPRAASYPT
jgi:hypothetical protein